MSKPITNTHATQPDPLNLAAGFWLASGVVLLGLTPLPLHDTTAGWSATFWLVLAPALALALRMVCMRRPCRGSGAVTWAPHGRGMRHRGRAGGAPAARRERRGQPPRGDHRAPRRAG